MNLQSCRKFSDKIFGLLHLVTESLIVARVLTAFRYVAATVTLFRYGGQNSSLTCSRTGWTCSFIADASANGIYYFVYCSAVLFSKNAKL